MIRLLRARDRRPVPWKNGGGTTTEVAVFPPDAGYDDFQWRISIADVKMGGPFSQFSGIDRKLAVLDGRMTLTIADREAIALSPDTIAAEFSGDASTEATLPDGPLSDLNVMTRRGVFRSCMSHYEDAGTLALELQADLTVILAVHPLSAEIDGGAFALDVRDGLLIQAPLARRVTLRSPRLDFHWVEIFPA
jgi:uncharacterized protein